MAQQQNNSIERNANNTALRQPASYPSPQQYPSPSISSYAYPPGGQNDSSYRASPTGSNVSLPSLNLPPIRTIDGRQQHQPQQQGGPSAMPPALAPPMNHQYYPGHTLPPPQHMHVTSDPNQPMRYPLPPPNDGRIMSGGRHKKEIKRRTKTGCLTCRKRRIKCDEAHPACRNCQKSKRDCLGYDPIFKTQPGPTNIQPAPIAVPNMQTNPAVGPSFHPPLQGYIPGGPQSYGPPLSAGANSSRSSTELYSHDNGAAIDPALETADGSSVQGPRVKRTKIEELCAIGDVSPPPLSFRGPLQTRQVEEIQAIYTHTYAPALDKFFETSWFKGWSLRRLLSNHRLCEQFATMLLRFSIEISRQYQIPNAPPNPDLDLEQKMTRSLETTVVWAMMGLAQPVVKSPDLSEEEKNAGVYKAAERFETLENLLLGQYLDPKPPSEQNSERNGDGGQGSIEPENKRQYDFWRHVRTFLTLRDDEASAAKEIDDTLANCRTVLESYENRDIIYSIMIARHIGQRLAEFPDSLPRPSTNDEADNRNKLHVAKSFIDRQQGKGTTQVVQRVCNMVVRSWSLPR